MELTHTPAQAIPVEIPSPEPPPPSQPVVEESSTTPTLKTPPTPPQAKVKAKAKPRVVNKSTPSPASAPVEEQVQETSQQARPSPPPPLQLPHTQAAYLNNPKPLYPMMARRQGWQGVVVLRVVVSEAGETLAVEVKRGSGYAMLDESASQTVRQWRFVPARLGDAVVRAEVEVPIRFSLQDT
ncbi:MAG: energy transducer TonB [Magnetococcales bacterium]|nr:energy transducer TonB [Magnetococcales bacterium]